MNLLLGGDNSNSFERGSENIINVPIGRDDTEILPHLRGNSSEENEIRDIET